MTRAGPAGKPELTAARRIRRLRREMRRWAGELPPAITTARAERDRLAEVERFAFFVGYPRSGHSLVGSLLDAHPDVVIAHEADALRAVAARLPRPVLYGLLLAADRRFTDEGRQWTDYDYRIAGSWQGRVRRLRVIGDKRGAGTVIALRRSPELLDRLRATVAAPIRVIHAVRDPWDNVATIAKRSTRGVTQAVDYYEWLVHGVAETVGRLDDGELHTLHHDDLLAEPRTQLASLFSFVGVGVDVDDGVVDGGASILFPSPSRTRHGVAWGSRDVDRLAALVESTPWLHRYSESERPVPGSARS